MAEQPAPVVPQYGGACVTGVVPAVLGRRDGAPAWLPEPVVDADQVVLLVLDGLGWEQLQARRHLAPTLAAMAGGPITTVAPSTTATALTSLTTGAPPAAHGIVGYRMLVPSDSGVRATQAGHGVRATQAGHGVRATQAGHGVRATQAGHGERAVLNVLRWTTPSGDARQAVPPESIQPLEPFLGTKPPVVTRSEFADSGFTSAHLSGSPLHGWRYQSTLVVRVAGLVAEGHELVYAYYPGVDAVAHEFGFGAIYDAEVAGADGLVAGLLDSLPGGAALLVVADHGQVFVGDAVELLAAEVAELTVVASGEGRFRWLHARPGQAGLLLDAARHHFGDLAWVRSRDQVVADGWLGGDLSPEVEARLGDVALVAHAPVAFDDPADTGSYRLQCRHGSLTSAEMFVPLVAARG